MKRIYLSLLLAAFSLMNFAQEYATRENIPYYSAREVQNDAYLRE